MGKPSRKAKSARTARAAGGGPFRQPLAGDTTSVSYIVAEPDKARAMAIFRTKIANPEYVFEDLGRVSAALLNAMKIEPDFVRA
jgi:hypothetical protein